ncbi:hypothetical protein B484DRAFT_392223 [Ochromonadaceae sp. CCMP2298]|nr:hypothetical protein B484DRAFT_392223 [Ochromonadaceae sp. CCMP2298]
MDMDDLDAFLADTDLTPKSMPSPGDEEDFLAFLDEPSPNTEPLVGIAMGDGMDTDVGTGTGGEGVITADTESDDFLDWLGDSGKDSGKGPSCPSPDSGPASSSTGAWSTGSFLERQDESELAGGAGEAVGGVALSDMDSFFNDVFGSPSPPSPNPATRTSLTTQRTKDEAVGAGVGGNGIRTLGSLGLFDADTEPFEQQLHTLVHATFPDVDTLRELLCEAQYVPESHRAAVWSLLLRETCVEDEEAVSYECPPPSTGMELLEADCAAAVALAEAEGEGAGEGTERAGAVGAEETGARLHADLRAILLLYCQRRDVEYKTAE